jgi:hypothetical protein
MNAAWNTYWILTETELKIVVVRHDACFGRNSDSGSRRHACNSVKTIALEHIIDCGTEHRAATSYGLACCCFFALPMTFVDTIMSANRTAWIVDAHSGAATTTTTTTTTTTAHPQYQNHHEATAVGLLNPQWFTGQVLRQRDIVKGRSCCHGHYTDPTTTGSTLGPWLPSPRYQQAQIPLEERGGKRTAAERIQEIMQLYESGLLSADELGKKKQEILDSI